MAFEDKLRSALEDAVKFCNEGSTPDEAVCKSASAHEFNKDQTDRLVETLNTAITINQYKQAADRTASFPLAHKDKVGAMMLDADKVLGKKEEKKAEANHIYFEYSKPAYDYIKHEDDVIEKAAENEEKTTGLSRDNLAYLLINQKKLVKNAADFAANIAGMMKSDLVSQLYGLADTIKKAGVEKYARLKVALGDNNEVVKNLNKVLPAKFAEASCRDSFVDDSDLTEEIKTASDMSETLSSMKDMRAQADSMHKQAAKMEQEITTAFIGEEEGPSTFLSLFKTADKKDDAIKDLQKKNKELLKKLEDKKKERPPNVFRQYAFGYQKDKPMQGLSKSDMFRSTLDELFFGDRSKENDDIENTVENVRRSLLLQDLMARDPIIAEADPDAVTSIYNSVLATSPQVANNKEVVRSILRQAVNSVATSPFDAQTWANLEKTQREGARV